MYGTIARLQAKPGEEAQIVNELGEFGRLNVPGAVAEYLYKTDADPDVYFLAVIFESKEAYVANANSPDQDSRYRKILASLKGAPEWHDGEIVHAQESVHAGI